MGTDYRRFSREMYESESGQHFVAGGRRFVLAGKINDGAIGIVKKARDVETGRLVAVKFLAPEYRYIEESSMADIHGRFRREGIRGAALEHENLVKIIAYEENHNAANFDGGDHPWNPFILMEYIRGKTLESFIKAQHKQAGVGSNLTPQTVRIGLAIAEALVYLHRRGIVHRDVKPANVFLSDEVRRGDPGAVKLGDFGVVKWNEFRAAINTGTLTVSGQQGLGTLKYMSPEQATKPKDVLIASDMYSLGATFYELFTNQVLDNHVHFLLITMARAQRGNTASRLLDLGLGIVPDRCEYLFSTILDMFALGPTSRPTSTSVAGRLRVLLEQLEGRT